MTSAQSNQRFPKAEHLCSRKLIEHLYNDGHRLRVFPYSVQWMLADRLDVPCQVLIVAPKRKLHHAVDRNRIKRLTRECYRLRKQPLIDLLRGQQKTLVLSLVYIHNEVQSFEYLGQRMDKLVAAIQHELEAQ